MEFKSIQMWIRYLDFDFEFRQVQNITKIEVRPKNSFWMELVFTVLTLSM